MSVVSTKQKKGAAKKPLRATRPKQDLVLMVIIDFPLPLKKALVKQAKIQGSNMTNVAVAALSEEFGVKFAPTTRGSSTPPGNSDRVSFAMPRRLREKIRVHSGKNDMTRRDVVIEILTERFM